MKKKKKINQIINGTDYNVEKKMICVTQNNR